ncbi:MAG: hypothetical protein PVG32_14320 [Anaerolineales bacterium]
MVPELAAGTRVNYLTDTVYKLAAGSLAPDDALRQIRMWVQDECRIERFGAETLSKTGLYQDGCKIQPH